MKTHTKAELETMAAQAKALAQSMADSSSQSVFAALARRLEQEAAELARKPVRRRPAAQPRQN